MFEAILKAGGSLYHHAELPALVNRWAELARDYRLLLMPGGGPFADQVRTAADRFQLSQSPAHWMAILAMDQYAYLLADLSPRASLVRDLNRAAAVNQSGRLAVLAPSSLLLAQDPLPHSWQVTSDSLAAWLAAYSRTERLVLLKSVTGIYQAGVLQRRVSKQALAGEEAVDGYFSQALAESIRCWLIDGRLPARLAELLARGQTTGTEIEKKS